MSAMQVEAVEREDSTPLNELTVAHIGEVRGIRKVITAIHEEIAQYLKD